MLEVIHSPKLEDLADQLGLQLRIQRRQSLENLLQPIVVVVGHLGIARWLEQRIAKQFGIFANVRFVLTGEWLNAQMVRFGILDRQDVERFSPASMTWALYALLESPERFGLVRANALLERERYQLAVKLARLYSEYLIYRRGWLLDFELEAARAPLRSAQSGAPVETKVWQARLWCALSARLQGTHRAAKFDALLKAIKSAPTSGPLIDAPSYFFGLNHLPPDLLTLLQQLSARASVRIYFPNPCAEYWADVVRERFLAQRQLGSELFTAVDAQDPAGLDHFDVGHPLLASLGGHGQAYFAELTHTTEHFTEATVSQVQAAPITLLAALQFGITHLQPDFVPADVQADQSIQIFSAHSLIDELAHAKAVVMAALVADPNLQLEEIAIMTPNLSHYAPLLAAVLGAELCASPPIAVATAAGSADLNGRYPEPRGQTALRYSVLDLTQASSSPLLEQLLNAPELRWEPKQLLALLTLDEVRQHFALEASDLALAPLIFQRAHIAFGFDDAHRRQLLDSLSEDTEPSASLHTWQAGLDRLLFGYLHGNLLEFNGDDAPAPVWPVPYIDVRHARILSAISRLIHILKTLTSETRQWRKLPDWIKWLDRKICELTGAFATDAVRAIFTQIELDAEHAELRVEVSFVALREALTGTMAQVSRRSTPALGAVCVCGLVPMRALPFKVICILGLNEAEFPKPEMPDSLNLMRANGARRLGDRSRTQEDRYLFLEAIMAARSQLFLSYQGLSNNGGVRQPCGVLAELLEQLRRQFSARVGSPWIAQSQPPKKPLRRGTAQITPRIHTLAPISPEVMPPEVIQREVVAKVGQAAQQLVLGVDEFNRFWKQPLSIYVQQCLRIAVLQTVATKAEEADQLEPLGLKLPPIERVEARLLEHALRVGKFPELAPAWLGRSGLLASGALGVQSYVNIEEDCIAAWIAIKNLYPEFIGAQKQAVRVDLDLGSTRLIGVIPGVYLKQRACVFVSNKALHGAQRLKLLLQVLMLRAAENDVDLNAAPAPNSSTNSNSPAAPWRAIHLGPRAAELQIDASPSEARSHLAQLIALRNSYLHLNQPTDLTPCAPSPPWFWPKLSYLAFEAGDEAHKKVLASVQSEQEFELSGSGLKVWLPDAGFFDVESPEFDDFLKLAQTVFAPLQQITSPANKAAVRMPAPVPDDLVAKNSPVRAFSVTKRTAPNSNSAKPSASASASPAKTDLKQFGDDIAADFDNE